MDIQPLGACCDQRDSLLIVAIIAPVAVAQQYHNSMKFIISPQAVISTSASLGHASAVARHDGYAVWRGVVKLDWVFGQSLTTEELMKVEEHEKDKECGVPSQ